MKNIVVLTGSGISQESGIKTFRDQNGLWENHPIEKVASPEAFDRDSAFVHRFYNLRRCQLDEVVPNKAHYALAALEASDEYDVTIITQNVDDLHERAGSENVLHMHGELKKIKSLQDQSIREINGEVSVKDYKNWRPDIVWFGEMIKCMEKIEKALEKADLYLCIGTSNQVYPAAGFINHINYRHIESIELNFEKTQLSHLYKESILGKASEVVPKFVRERLGVEIEKNI